MSKIKVIDARMGLGKTSYSIQMMNENKNNKYVFITPFLEEVRRIKEQCSDRKFKEPLNYGTSKQESLHKLLSENENIVSTHALFRMSTDVTRELIECGDYVLILDEVMDVIEQVPIKKDDLSIMLNEGLIRIENDFVVWNEDKLNISSAYDDIKIMCLNHSLMMVNNTLLMWNFPVNVFNSFKEVYILTYKFKSQIQRYYYDLHNVEYEYYSIFNNDGMYSLINYQIKEDLSSIRNNIEILTDDKINNIGEKDYTLSSTWFSKVDNKPLLEVLRNNMVNYFINKCKAKSKDILWTTFKDSKASLSGKGYTKSFISCNLRATNEYGDRHYLAYCLNVFLNPIVKQFFINKGVQIDEEGYALSEMIQWIWRSAIRNNEKVYIYIPSKRMRELLIRYLL